MVKIFLRGLMAFLPVSITLYIIYNMVVSLEEIMMSTILKDVPMIQNLPGIGILIFISFIFFLGLLMGTLPPFSRLISMLQLPFKNIPMVKSIYTAIEDLLFFFSSGNNDGQNKVVRVVIPEQKVEFIGLITRKDLHLIEGLNIQKGMVAVFIPMSYALGGYTIMVPGDWLQPVNLSVEVAMKSAITAWMKKDQL
jgi:uncharacterized membrane protein